MARTKQTSGVSAKDKHPAMQRARAAKKTSKKDSSATTTEDSGTQQDFLTPFEGSQEFQMGSDNPQLAQERVERLEKLKEMYSQCS